ncbi:DUF4900 domain-containing protein [Meiothermus sp. Pnk-1]|uniref:DUF4900 domain-containing protein n=2 Tax=unclassified Meiothermus TaxID=370471 RepID=UPI00351AAD8C
MLARGGANVAGALLTGPVRDRLRQVVNATSSTTNRWSYGGNGSGTQPDPATVASDLAVVAGQLQTQVDSLVCDLNPAPAGSGATVRVRVYFTNTACAGSTTYPSGVGLPTGVKLPSGRFVDGSPRGGTGDNNLQQYSLPFVMVAEATQGTYRRNVVLQGEYRFPIGRSSFARYALFTNVHASRGGEDIWFTDRTLFDGPVHTNQYFRFYRNPWFGGEVTSAGCTSPGVSSCSGSITPGASFMSADGRSQNFIAESSMSPNASAPTYRGTQPAFTDGVSWRSSFVKLPDNDNRQREAANDRGLLFASNLYSLDLYATDSNGNLLTRNASGQWQPAATYQYIKACTSSSSSSCTEYRYTDGPSKVLYRKSGSSWVVVQNNFNGVIYVEGSIDRLRGPSRVPANSSNPDNAPPALAHFAEITIAARNDIRITRDLKYENPPCSSSPTRNPDGSVTRATCDNLDVNNILGIYAQGTSSDPGDILIGGGDASSGLLAPANIAIQGVLMSSRGIVGVENYNSISPAGDVNLLGGIIEYYYGAFGTFNSSTGTFSTGYGRKFTYDQRMLNGKAPPYFPTTELDEVGTPRVISFGQREQVY